MYVHKAGDRMSDKISVNRGTKQNGLNSPFIFNIFYGVLITELQTCNYVVTIKDLRVTLIYLGTVARKKMERLTVQADVEQQVNHYALQGAGIKFPGVWPSVAIDLYKIGIQSSRLCGCASVFITRSQLQIMDKYQNKLIKQCLGVCQRAHSTPLLKP